MFHGFFLQARLMDFWAAAKAAARVKTFYNLSDLREFIYCTVQ